ncbi:hypothetical protein DV738_g1825, partial [Chaetothyriales sp. CBS 135597]
MSTLQTPEGSGVLTVAADSGPRKSYRRKYRKIMVHFQQKMQESNSLFKDEQRMLDISLRLAEQTDQLLDLLTELNSLPQVPPSLRFDLDMKDESGRQASDIGAQITDEQSGHIALRKARYRLQLGQIDAGEYNDIKSSILRSPAFAAETSYTSLLKYASALPETAAGASDSPGHVANPFLSTKQEDQYLQSLDSYIAGTSSNLRAHASHSFGTKSTEKPSERDKEIQLQNPVSVYNWLRKHEPKVFLQDNESTTDKTPRTTGSRLSKRNANRDSIMKQEQEMYDEDGFALDVGSTAKGKRKRDDDGGYRPKGDGSRPSKKKKDDGSGGACVKKAKKPSSYLVRWVNVKAEYSISWTIQPHKKSLNFGLFKHPGHTPGQQPAGGSAATTTTTAAAGPGDDEAKADPNAPSIVEKLQSTGLRQVVWVGRCEADKITQGRYDVPANESGNYALVFDNTFSQHLSKTATFFLLTFPTAVLAHVQYGAQLHHSQAAGSAPRLRPFAKPSADSLRKSSNAGLSAAAGDNGTATDESSTIHTGVLSKRRRKKGQGYARRFFCLDYATSTLSYYHNRNSSALHGAIPLSLAAIGANTKSREISIDSGAEIWHLRAPNQAEFEKWKAALEKASHPVVEPASPANGVIRAATIDGTTEGGNLDEHDWARLETLLSRLSGIRDAVRRFSLETVSASESTLAPSSGVAAPSDDPSEDSLGPDQRPKAFWKRKASTNNGPTTASKRNVSAQLTVPEAGPGGVRRTDSKRGQEDGLHGRSVAMLHDIDVVVAEFNSIINRHKFRRSVPPVLSASRLSMHSVDSQEYFDAEDELSTKLLDIHSDEEKDNDREEADDGVADDDSAASSDIEDDGLLSAASPTLLPPRAKNLQPLPLQTVHRRATVPAPTITPPSLIGFLRKNVGKDLSSIAMPVSANEPTSLLQRSAEGLEYSELLDQAAQATDSQEQLLLVTAFALSPLSNARIKERAVRKPFNPMLGETYELVREDKGFRFVSEKVSHRPVQLAFHAESNEWAFAQSPLPLQKFWGKSSEIITDGKARLIFFNSGRRYTWINPTCFLRNIIAGEKYIEPVGTMTVFSETDGSKAVVTFKAKGMFSGRSEELEVDLFDPNGNSTGLGLEGTWTHSLQRKENGVATKKSVWTAGPLVQQAPKHYGMTLFAASLNEVTDVEKGHLAPTDSRLRLDQQALERGDHDKAEELKNALEEAQRARRRELEAAGQEWSPRWFTKVEHGDEIVWKLKTGKEGYWEERSKGQWSGDIVIINPCRSARVYDPDFPYLLPWPSRYKPGSGLCLAVNFWTVSGCGVRWDAAHTALFVPQREPDDTTTDANLSLLKVAPYSVQARCEPEPTHSTNITYPDPSAIKPLPEDSGTQAPNEAQSDSDDRGVRICPFQVDLVRDSQGQSQVFGYGAWSVVLKGTCQARTVLNGSGSSSHTVPVAPTLPTPTPLSPTKTVPLVVAVKRPARIDAIPILENEGRILTYLSRIHDSSKHVVTFYGSLAPEHSNLVLEALPVSLEEYIKRCASVARRTLTTWNMTQPVVGSADAWLSLAESLIRALAWLHDEAGVVHGDIKPGNFVLKQIEPAYDQTYTAPELLVSSVLRDPTAQATKQSDVFSLAITLLVAATGNTMVYPGSVFQRQAMATRGWQVLDMVRSSGDAIEDGGARVPRHGVVDRALDRSQPATGSSLYNR